MFKTITAKFAGTCKRCNGAIDVGTRIRYGGRGRTYHLKAECPAGATTDGDTAQQAVSSATDGAAGRPAFDEDEEYAAIYGFGRAV